MSGPALHPTPRPWDVLTEQVRAVGLALRGPAVVAGALAALASFFLLTELLLNAEPLDFHPQRWLLPALLGLLLPIAVWNGRERSEASFLWTLPVDRRRHALTRVLAGWLWLMGAVALFVLWLLAVTLISGGSLVAEETVRFLPASSHPALGRIDPGAVRTEHWTPHPLIWLVPFTAATATYLIASALALGATLRGIALAVLGLFVLVFLASAAGKAAGSEWLIFAPSRVVRAVVYEPYGLAMLLTTTTEFLAVYATLPTGETVLVGRGAPDLGRWATATLLWTGAGLLALWAAASRHRENRSP